MSDPNDELPRIGEEEPKQLGESSIISSGSGSGSGNSNPIIVNVPRRKRPRQGSGGEHTESGYAATTAKKKVSRQSNSLLKKPSSSSITSYDSLRPTQQSLPGGQISVDSSGRDSTTTNTTTNNNREAFINTTAAPSVTNTNSSSTTHDSRGVLSPIFTPEHWAQQLQLQLQQRVLLPQTSTGVMTSTESSSARSGSSSLPSSSDVSTPQFSYQPPSAVAQMLRAHQASASSSSAAPSATAPSTDPATTKDRKNVQISFTEDDPTHRHALNFVTSGQQQEQQHQGIFYAQGPATTNPPATASNATAQAGVPGQYYPLLLDGGQNPLLVTYAQAFSQMQQHHQGIQVDAAAAAAAVGQMHQTTRTNHQQNQLPVQVADVYTAATGQPQRGLPTSMVPSLLPNFAGGVIPTQPPSNNTGETSSAVSILPFGNGYGCLRCRLAWFPSYEEAFNHVWLNCEGLTRSDIPTHSASNHPASQSTEQRQGTLSFGGTPHLQTQQHIHGQNNMNMPSIDTSVLGTFMGPHQINAISLQSPLSSVPLRAAGASLISHANTQPHQWLRGVSLGTEQDCRKLSQQQCLIREQIEAFSTNIYDLNIHIRGRNKQVALGQVGIQCCHCSFLPVGDRSAGSVYFPSSVSGIYQAAQNMFKYHLKDGCAQMPVEVRELCNRITQSKSSRGGGKQYWATSAHSIGLLDSPQGIRFQHDVASMPQQPSPQLSAGASDVVNQQVVDPYVQNLSLLSETGQKIMKETSDKTILGMVLPRDKECLTTYLYMLFAQVKYCQLAQSDQVGFRRKEQNVGLPGLECKHCQGSMGCGRSFRSTSTSLAKNENIAQVFNHTLRCSSCPMDIKRDLTVLKERHGSEVSRLKRGWKKMFFDDLMRRLLNQRGEKSAEEKG